MQHLVRKNWGFLWPMWHLCTSKRSEALLPGWRSLCWSVWHGEHSRMLCWPPWLHAFGQWILSCVTSVPLGLISFSRHSCSDQCYVDINQSLTDASDSFSFNYLWFALPVLGLLWFLHRTLMRTFVGLTHVQDWSAVEGEVEGRIQEVGS
jgi:hypothetical protein